LFTDLFNQVNAGLQVHAEVDKLPLDAFLLVLFLLEDEHVMVEELLQALVGVVDAQLLERVVLTTNSYQYCQVSTASRSGFSVCRTTKYNRHMFLAKIPMVKT